MVADRAPRGGADKRWLALLVALLFASLAAAQDAASLQARHAALREQLDSNPYRRPLHIASQVGDGTLQGDVHARFGQPFAVLGAALQDVGHWCDILILHPNVKGCRVRPGDRLELNLGRKFEQPLDDTQPFAFRFRVLSARSDYLALALDADSGGRSLRGGFNRFLRPYVYRWPHEGPGYRRGCAAGVEEFVGDLPAGRVFLPRTQMSGE